MEEKIGIKEAKEALIGINELAIFLAARLKDGIGVDDAMAVFMKLKDDEAFKAKIGAAYDGIAAVPAELKDMDLSEGMDLAMVQISYLPAIIGAMKKEA